MSRGKIEQQDKVNMDEEIKKTPKVMLTGDRPTGRLHIGHYVGSLRRRVELQNQGDFDEMYIMIADTQALDNLISKIKNIKGVKDVQRSN